MATITKIFCDICAREDKNAYAWFLGPWTRDRDCPAVEFAVCRRCIPTVTDAIKDLLKPIPNAD